MSDVSRRGAIYVHRSDMESLKNNNYSTKNSRESIGAIPKASSSDRFRTKSEDQERRSKSTIPSSGQSRRGSVATGGRRGSTMGDGYLRRGSVLPETGSGGRRQSTVDYGRGPASGRRGSSHPGDGAYNRRGSRMDDMSYSPHQRRKKKSAEPEPALTKEQVEAFQEVFDLFDSNGGGTIDADELQLALSSVDIHLPAQDIRDVLEGIDKDGSGEIDFEEFLTLMTNTEKFLETVADSHDEHALGEDDVAGGRETVLFDALTKFMKTSALKQMDVLERYFNTKYKRAQAPHVVMHYAAGARLIGLTEKQLAQHLDRLQESNEEYDYKSPYAEPLRIMLAPQRNVRKKKKKKKRIKDETVDVPDERPRLTGKIRIRVHFKSEDDNTTKVEENKKEEELVSQVVGQDTKKKRREWVPRLGWIQPNVKRIADRLPKMKIIQTMDDLSGIRQKIQAATKEYDHDLAISRRRANNLYWKTLRCDKMNETQLINFKRVFHAYSDIGKLVAV
ncbi:uncharacterized protein LOC129264684 [Lytechinus pictus]|uniref:uncharacterized protein LOC129264684 n=1 Tax=Lytechinus pictus TaxID=7653 RepID=UPI00240DA89E|nr:uncharacterized protein LOC129264684 [Lytechinus pictus]